MVSYLGVVCVQPGPLNRDDGISLLCDWTSDADASVHTREWFMRCQNKLPRRSLGGENIAFTDRLTLNWMGELCTNGYLKEPFIVRYAAILDGHNSSAVQMLLKDLRDTVSHQFIDDQRFAPHPHIDPSIQTIAQPLLAAVAKRYMPVIGVMNSNMQTVLESSERFESKISEPVAETHNTSTALKSQCCVRTERLKRELLLALMVIFMSLIILIPIFIHINQ